MEHCSLGAAVFRATCQGRKWLPPWFSTVCLNSCNVAFFHSLLGFYLSSNKVLCWSTFLPALQHGCKHYRMSCFPGSCIFLSCCPLRNLSTRLHCNEQHIAMACTASLSSFRHWASLLWPLLTCAAEASRLNTLSISSDTSHKSPVWLPLHQGKTCGKEDACSETASTVQGQWAELKTGFKAFTEIYRYTWWMEKMWAKLNGLFSVHMCELIKMMSYQLA